MFCVICVWGARGFLGFSALRFGLVLRAWWFCYCWCCFTFVCASWVLCLISAFWVWCFDLWILISVVLFVVLFTCG